MIIGVPTEIKSREFRVGMIPAGVRILTSRGHTVLVQAGAGLGSGITDDDAQKAGAQTGVAREEVRKRADVLVQVMDALVAVLPLVRVGYTVMTYYLPPTAH